MSDMNAKIDTILELLTYLVEKEEAREREREEEVEYARQVFEMSRLPARTWPVFNPPHHRSGKISGIRTSLSTYHDL